jgi:hypothetical protein
MIWESLLLSIWFKGCANLILRQSNPEIDPSPTISKMWIHRFEKRLPKGFMRVVQKLKDPKQLTAEDLGIIQTWYDRLEIDIRSYKITTTNIYNFDETRFQIGQGKKEAVITTHLETSHLETS